MNVSNSQSKSGYVEIEMNDIGQDPISQPEEVKHQNKITTTRCGRVFKVYETNWQCPGLTASFCCALFATIAAAISVAGFIFARTQTDTTYEVCGYVVGGFAAAVTILLIVDSAIHCIDCTAIGHYVPERAFEKNIGTYHKENLRLTNEVDHLKQERDLLQSVAERLKNLTKEHDEISARLDGILQSKNGELQHISSELTETSAKLAQAEEAMKSFEEQLNNLKNVLVQLGNTNKEFKDYLGGLDLKTEDLDQQRVEWDADLQNFSQGNNQYERLNNQANQLSTVLAKQMDLMALYRDSIEQNMKKLIEETHELDETDDKLTNASIQLSNIVIAKEEVISELKIQNAALNSAILQMRQALEEIKDSPNLARNLSQIIDAFDTASTLSDSESTEHGEFKHE